MRENEVVLHKKTERRKKKNTIPHKVEALSKQRAHTVKGNTHAPTPNIHAHAHTHTHSLHTISLFFYTEQEWRHSPSAAAGISARIHAEQLDAMGTPVEAHSRVEDQGPDVGDEEILGLVFFHIFKLELRKLLFTEKEEEKCQDN